MGRGRQHYLTRSNVFLTSSMKAVFVLISILLGLLSWTEKSQSLVKKFSGSEYGEIIVKPLERSVREERIGKNKNQKQKSTKTKSLPQQIGNKSKHSKLIGKRKDHKKEELRKKNKRIGLISKGKERKQCAPKQKLILKERKSKKILPKAIKKCITEGIRRYQ